MKIISLIIGSLIAATSIAQNIALDAGWKFSQQDKPAFAQAGFNDAQWKEGKVNTAWENFLNEKYDGIGWYRKKVVIPTSMQKVAMEYGFMQLELGKIDDADECYFNGVLVGKTGQFPPVKETAWDITRSYKIPLKLIRWNQPNTIAVRVSDWGGGGGLYTGQQYALLGGSWRLMTKVAISFSNLPNYDLPVPSNLNSNFTFLNTGKKAINAICFTGIRNFENKLIAIDSQPINIAANSNLSFQKIWGSPEPGFYHAFAIIKTADGNSLEEKVGFAASPLLKRSRPDNAADFAEFWQSTKKELAAIDPQFEVEPQPKLATPQFDISLVEMRSYNNVRVRAWLMMPKGKTKPPAILHVQGYSTNNTAWGGDSNFAHLFLNIRGHGNSQDDVNPGFPGFLQSGLEDKSKYIYRGAFMDCIRAMDFLCSQYTTIDTSRIGVEGASQGGALTFVTAAMDKRIKCAAPDVPFLSDYRNYFRIANWPANEFKTYVEKNNADWETIYQTLSYFDIKNFAPMINCPVMMGVGLFDDICPPHINFAAFNNIPVNDKLYFLYPKAGHSVPAVHYNLKNEWLKKQLLVSSH
jgi:cephalosporin-C deacetylase